MAQAMPEALFGPVFAVAVICKLSGPLKTLTVSKDNNE